MASLPRPSDRRVRHVRIHTLRRDRNTPVARPRENEEKSVELTEPEKCELEALRKDVKRLRMEREILKRAVVFWVKESSE